MTRRKPMDDKAIRGWLSELAEGRADMGLAQRFAEDLLATRKALRAYRSGDDEYECGHCTCDCCKAARRCLPEGDHE